jgi:hypothetical protein
MMTGIGVLPLHAYSGHLGWLSLRARSEQPAVARPRGSAIEAAAWALTSELHVAC